MVGGEGQVFVIKAVEAGGLVEDLGFEILDQDGNRLATPAKGQLLLWPFCLRLVCVSWGRLRECHLP